MTFWNNTKYLPKKFSDRTLNKPQEFLIFFDSAHNNVDCIPTTVVRPYPYLSENFDHPLNDKALKKFTTPASKDYSFSELPVLTAQ